MSVLSVFGGENVDILVVFADFLGYLLWFPVFVYVIIGFLLVVEVEPFVLPTLYSEDFFPDVICSFSPLGDSLCFLLWG